MNCRNCGEPLAVALRPRLYCDRACYIQARRAGLWQSPPRALQSIAGYVNILPWVDKAQRYRPSFASWSNSRGGQQ